MMKEFAAERIRQEFQPELEPLMDLGLRMREFRDRIEKLRTAKCVMWMAGRKVVFGYFESVLSDKWWPKYARELSDIQTRIDRAIQAPIQ